MPLIDQDMEHLRILAICQYVHAGICAVYALFPIIHLIMGLFFILGTHGHSAKGSTNECPPEFIGWLFVGMALVIIIIGMTLASSMFLTGRYMNHRKHWLACIILSGLQCIIFPTGTTLGIFSIVILTRPNVKRMFGVKLSKSEADLLELTEPTQP